MQWLFLRAYLGLEDQYKCSTLARSTSGGFALTSNPHWRWLLTTIILLLRGSSLVWTQMHYNDTLRDFIPFHLYLLCHLCWSNENCFSERSTKSTIWFCFWMTLGLFCRNRASRVQIETDYKITIRNQVGNQYAGSQASAALRRKIKLWLMTLVRFFIKSNQVFLPRGTSSYPASLCRFLNLQIDPINTLFLTFIGFFAYCATYKVIVMKWNFTPNIYNGHAKKNTKWIMKWRPWIILMNWQPSTNVRVRFGDF